MSASNTSLPAAQLASLDMLRGVAALGVMVYHAPAFGSASAGGGYLAVDLFFLLSGFVIMHAYGARMATGMSARAFLYRRIARLWPMLALGALLGVALFGGHWGSLFLLPHPHSTSNLFPANPPLWSLMCEAAAYAVFALGLWRLRPALLAALAAASAICLAWLGWNTPPLSDLGAHWHTLGGGLARVAFGFSGGMLLWHAQQRFQPRRRISWMAWVPALALTLVMASGMFAETLGALVAIVLIFPAILWMAVRWEVPQVRLAKTLGHLSYPLYCIHVPLLVWLASDPRTGAAIAIALFALLPISALALERWIERPARALLTRLLVHPATPVEVTPASA